jgi:ribulose-phosphate 3-epimerase
MEHTIKILPSLVSAPFGNLSEVISELEELRADGLHFDIEDGHFVPLMSLGTKIIGELRPISEIPFDIHLMVNKPEYFIPMISELGVDSITVHYEACEYPRRVLRMIKTLDKKSGLALNAKTPIPDLAYLLPYLNMINIQTTEPEIPDAPFIEQSYAKIRQASELVSNFEVDIDIVADGGLNQSNIPNVIDAGADVLVIGRGIFKYGNVKDDILKIRKLVNSEEIGIDPK